MRKTKILTTAVVLLLALPGVANAAPAGDVHTADTRPPGCEFKFQDPNPRERVVNKETVIHEMSNPPVCSPHGPHIGTLSAQSHFVVYYADPQEPLWCYGYSVQIARTGYILCGDYD
jgi:hypothetical protein